VKERVPVQGKKGEKVKVFLRLLTLGLFALVVASCSTTPVDTPDTTPDTTPGETPLLTDADIDAAVLLDMSTGSQQLRLSQGGVTTLDLSEGSAPSALGRALSELRTNTLPEDAKAGSRLEPLAVEFDAPGHLAYVQTVSTGGETFYTIRIRATRQGKPGYPNSTLIYRGKREVDSVAVSQDGRFISFIVEDKNGNAEVYAYDGSGEVFGQEQFSQLTATDTDESNLSMSLDGHTLAWQGVNEGEDDAPDVSNFTVVDFDLSVPSFSRSTFNFGELPVFEPSLSGDGSLVAFVADFGGLADPSQNQVAIIPSDGSDDATGLYAGDIHDPSLTFGGDGLMFKVTSSGQDTVVFDNGVTVNPLLREPADAISHPYVTSGGFYFTYVLDGSVRARAIVPLDPDNPTDPEEDIVDAADGDANSQPYWAKVSFDIRNIGTTFGRAKFTRPDNGGGLSDKERTSRYRPFTFEVPVTAPYEITSSQDYDGYILLYEGNFDPDNPEENLIAQNDDFGGGYSEEDGGNSRIYLELEAGKRYNLVTTACGSTNCGPDEGYFVTLIARGSAPVLPPDSLPEPDTSRYNITLRFVTDNLTDAQKAVFTDAAERWSAIITEDLQDIPNFSLPQDFIFPNTPPVEGTVDDLLIDVAFNNIDGPSGILGRAGPRLIRDGTEDDPLSIYGTMEFDISEFAPGGFFDDMQQYQDVIVHEMGHVIGIGTLWELTGNTEGILNDPPTVPAGLPNPDYDPRFTGEGAVAEYQALLDLAGYPEEATVPIANTGGPGNYNGHWRELTFDNELMTPYAGGAELLSSLTAASLGDLGYVVDTESDAVDEDYRLPPPRIPGVFEQTAPNEVTYQEGQDFLAAGDSAKATVEDAVVNVDLNLDDLEGSTSGCEAEDFGGEVSGNIALVRRGACAFADKVLNAQAAGATGVIIMNQGNAPDRVGLLDPVLGDAADTIPVLFVTFDLGVDLANTDGLEVLINTGVESGNLSTAMLKPSFEEELLSPIGTVGPDGEITLFE